MIIDWFGWLADWSICRFIDRLVGWLIDWLVSWLADWSIDWLIDWLIVWFIYLFIYSLIDWSIDWLGLNAVSTFCQSYNYRKHWRVELTTSDLSSSLPRELSEAFSDPLDNGHWPKPIMVLFNLILIAIKWFYKTICVVCKWFHTLGIIVPFFLI